MSSWERALRRVSISGGHGGKRRLGSRAKYSGGRHEEGTTISVMSGLWGWWRRESSPNNEESGGSLSMRTAEVDETDEELEEMSQDGDPEEEEEVKKEYVMMDEENGDGEEVIQKVIEDLCDQVSKLLDSPQIADQPSGVSIPEEQVGAFLVKEVAEVVSEDELSDSEWELSNVPTVTLTLQLQQDLADMEECVVPLYEAPLYSANVSLAPVYSTVLKLSSPSPQPPTSPSTPLPSLPPPSPQPSCISSVPSQPTSLSSLIPPPLPPPDWEDFVSNNTIWRMGRMRRVKKWLGGSRVHIPNRFSKMLSQDYICHQGQSGFEDLRRYIKQGGDFCKELAAILQERSEAETQYGKTLAKLSLKLVKATKEATGTVNTAWHRVAVEMEAQADVHRNFASSLSEEVVRPLRQLIESQHRIRKSVETAVDKSGKNLAEWRGAETKAKKNSFTCARENEKLRDGVGEQRTRLSTSSLHIPTKPTPEKETAKMETKRRKAEECVKKADVEYYSVCLRAERSRLEWESAVLRGSHCFQVLEEERLRGLKDLASSYLCNLQHVGPKITQISDRLGEPIKDCELSKDMETVVSLKAGTEPSQEQILPDFYPEHTTLAMNRERRKQALIKLLDLIRSDLERERRGKAGVENLAIALKRTPTFASEDSHQNVQDKLHHMRSMLTYLEAARYKVLCVLSELEGRPRPSHPLADHILVSRDRQGYQQSILKVPPWIHSEAVEVNSDLSDWVDRGTADGTSVQPDSDFDEFSSQGSDKDYETVVRLNGTAPTRCRALYNYTANLYDELSLSPGDIINIHDKQPDGWWLGELNGVVGIFPATYVEEIK